MATLEPLTAILEQQVNLELILLWSAMTGEHTTDKHSRQQVNRKLHGDTITA